MVVLHYPTADLPLPPLRHSHFVHTARPRYQTTLNQQVVNIISIIVRFKYNLTPILVFLFQNIFIYLFLRVYHTCSVVNTTRRCEHPNAFPNVSVPTQSPYGRSARPRNLHWDLAATVKYSPKSQLECPSPSPVHVFLAALQLRMNSYRDLGGCHRPAHGLYTLHSHRSTTEIRGHYGGLLMILKSNMPYKSDALQNY